MMQALVQAAAVNWPCAAVHSQQPGLLPMDPKKIQMKSRWNNMGQESSRVFGLSCGDPIRESNSDTSIRNSVHSWQSCNLLRLDKSLWKHTIS